MEGADARRAVIERLHYTGFSVCFPPVSQGFCLAVRGEKLKKYSSVCLSIWSKPKKAYSLYMNLPQVRMIKVELPNQSVRSHKYAKYMKIIAEPTYFASIYR